MLYNVKNNSYSLHKLIRSKMKEQTEKGTISAAENASTKNSQAHRMPSIRLETLTQQQWMDLLRSDARLQKCVDSSDEGRDGELLRIEVPSMRLRSKFSVSGNKLLWDRRTLDLICAILEEISKSCDEADVLGSLRSQIEELNCLKSYEGYVLLKKQIQKYEHLSDYFGN